MADIQYLNMITIKLLTNEIAFYEKMEKILKLERHALFKLCQMKIG